MPTSSATEEKATSGKNILTWYTSEGVQEGQVTNEIEC